MNTTEGGKEVCCGVVRVVCDVVFVSTCCCVRALSKPINCTMG